MQVLPPCWQICILFNCWIQLEKQSKFLGPLCLWQCLSINVQKSSLFHIWNIAFQKNPSAPKCQSNTVWAGLRLLLGVEGRQPIGDPASVYHSALWLPVRVLCNCSLYQAAGSVACVVYCSARGWVQAAIWQLCASQSWRANANHCPANTHHHLRVLLQVAFPWALQITLVTILRIFSS